MELVRPTMDDRRFNEYCEQIKGILTRNFGYEEEKFCYHESDNEIKKRNLSERTELLYLSNGDALKYQIPKYTLAHLLGINTDYLISNGYVKSNNSYDALIEVIEHPSLLKNKYKLNYEDFVSPYIDKKINSLIENLHIRLEECEFACKFDISKSYGYNNDNDMDYFIVTKNESANKYYNI